MRRASGGKRVLAWFLCVAIALAFMPLFGDGIAKAAEQGQPFLLAHGWITDGEQGKDYELSSVYEGIASGETVVMNAGATKLGDEGEFLPVEGLSFQWEICTVEGTTDEDDFYEAIQGATDSSLTVTPTVDTKYRCVVSHDTLGKSYCYFTIRILTADQVAVKRLAKAVKALKHYTKFTISDKDEVMRLYNIFTNMTAAQKAFFKSEYDTRYYKLMDSVEAIKDIDKAAAALANAAMIRNAQAVQVTVKAKALKKKKVKLSWNKANGVTGYEIYQGAKAKGNFKKVATINNPSTVVWKSKKIKKGKKAFFKIRSYRVINGKVYYGVLSGAKGVKLKK